MFLTEQSEYSASLAEMCHIETVFDIFAQTENDSFFP